MAVTTGTVQYVYQGTADAGFNGTTAWAPTVTSIANGTTIVVMFGVANVARTLTSIVANGTTPTTLTIDQNVTHGTAIYRRVCARGTVQSDCTSITITMSGTIAAGVSCFLISIPVSGLATSPADQFATTDLTDASTHPSGSITPSVADALVVGAFQGGTGTYSQPATGGWTSILSGVRVIAAYKVITTSAAVEYIPTSSAPETGLSSIACYKGPGGGDGGPSTSAVDVIFF